MHTAGAGWDLTPVSRAAFQPDDRLPVTQERELDTAGGRHVGLAYSSFLFALPGGSYLIRNTVDVAVVGFPLSVLIAPWNLANLLGVGIALAAKLALRSIEHPRLLRTFDIGLTVGLITLYLFMGENAPDAFGPSAAFNTLAAMLILFVRALLVPSDALTSGILAVLSFTLICVLAAWEAPTGADAIRSITVWITWGGATVAATSLASVALRRMRTRSRVADQLGAYQLETRYVSTTMERPRTATLTMSWSTSKGWISTDTSPSRVHSVKRERLR